MQLTQTDRDHRLAALHVARSSCARRATSTRAPTSGRSASSSTSSSPAASRSTRDTVTELVLVVVTEHERPVRALRPMSRTRSRPGRHAVPREASERSASRPSPSSSQRSSRSRRRSRRRPPIAFAPSRRDRHDASVVDAFVHRSDERPVGRRRCIARARRSRGHVGRVGSDADERCHVDHSGAPAVAARRRAAALVEQRRTSRRSRSSVSSSRPAVRAARSIVAAEGGAATATPTGGSPPQRRARAASAGSEGSPARGLGEPASRASARGRRPIRRALPSTRDVAAAEAHRRREADAAEDRRRRRTDDDLSNIGRR